MGNCHTVGPNEALVISGGCCGNQGKKYLVGGYGWAWCLVTEVQRISLEIMTLLPSVTNCESAKGNVLHFYGLVIEKPMNSRLFWFHSGIYGQVPRMRCLSQDRKFLSQ